MEESGAERLPDAQRAGEREVARWLAAGGLTAALGLLLQAPGLAALAHSLGLVAVLLAGAALGQRRHTWPLHVAFGSLLAGLGGARWGALAAVWLGALLLQAASGMLAPSLRTALLGAAVIGAAAAAGGAWSGAPFSWLIVPLVGLALAGGHARLLDLLASNHAPAPAPRIGRTHDRLARAEQELAVVTSQLRRESKQRRDAEAQALTAMTTRTAFLGVMSHELRTPLHQIIGYSELLLEEMSEEAPDVAADVRRIHLASLNLLEMIGNVLDLARIEAGTVTVGAEPFEIGELIENLVQEFASAAQQRGNVIRVRCPEPLPPLHSDRIKLRAVLASLLSNACKFTRDGTIRLAVARTQHAGAASLVVEVQDTGIGIPPDGIDRLFAAFVQVDGSSTRRHDGSGLGLAIAHHFCAMLGGEITVESAPGEGSTFCVRVPWEFVDPRHAGHILSSTVTRPPSSPFRRA